MSLSVKHLFAVQVPVLEFSPLGLKGAAFAAFGDNPEALAAEPFTAKDVEVSEAGVKLGESTLNFFFVLKRTYISSVRRKPRTQ